MGRFIKMLSVMLSMLAVIILVALTVVDRSGLTDEYYKRFTSSGQKSLIVGTSRAAQGMVPQVIDSCLCKSGYELPMYNFAFDFVMAPYGETYYKSVSRKVSHSSRDNSLFILAVDPFALSIIDELDKGGLREKKDRTFRVRHFYKPNFSYLLQYCHIAQWRHLSSFELHDNGWLEIKAVNIEDTLAVADAIVRKMNDYNAYTVHPSSYRMEWLEKTVDLLSQYGDVYLCRMPVSTEMSELEQRVWPEFDEDMSTLTIEKGDKVRYISFLDRCGCYRTTDGNHLYRDDARLFTEDLCDSIRIGL